MKSCDVVIIGAGPAGLTAGIYAARSGLETIVISKDIGGSANSILLLENWPGFKGTGSKLMHQFYTQLKEYDVEIIMSDVEKIIKKGKDFLVETKKEKIECGAVIVASGTERRKMNVPGEKEFTGKGVSYCITCDAFFFKDKIVSVIGGSDCAATSALALSDMTKKVYIFYRGEKLKCEDIISKRLERKKNVEIYYNSVPKEILGKDKVEVLVYEQKGKKKEIRLDGIFVEIGSIPITDFIKELNLKMDEKKCIIVDEEMKTSVPGIFAAGDVTHHKLKQIVVASGQGAIAAKSAYEYVSKKNYEN